MKKYRLLAALLAALLFSAAGCGGAVNAPGATDKPGAETPGAEASGAEAPGETPESADIRYGSRTNTVYFPEGAGDADADYILTYTLPVFMPEELNCAALNAALALYEEELTERVRTERLPLADRAEGEPAPCTTVEFAASSAAGYWSIRLFETVSYGAERETIPFVLVLDAAGSEQSFAAVSGQYEPDALVAQQIYNAIDLDPDAYFGDVTPEDVRLALDLMNGFAVTQTGYEVFIPAGVLAPEAAGTLTFSIPRAALYPDCVGEAISVSEYETLLPAFEAIAAACVPNYEGFSDGSPSAYAASAFLTHMLTTGNESTAWLDVPAESYEASFAEYFSGAFPMDIPEWGDGTLLLDGVYRVPVHPRAAYALRVDEAVRTKDSLIVYGMLLYGLPGTEGAGELAALVLTLAPADTAPLGFHFVSAELA